MSDNSTNNNNGAGDEEDNNRGTSHKRMRPETAALQLLELSGSVKRARSVRGKESVTTHTRAEEGGQGQFDDASSTEDHNGTAGKAGSQSEGSITAISKPIKDFSPNQFRQDGQFDDASEDDVDVPDIPLHFWKTGGREKGGSSQQAPTPSPVPLRQPLQVPPRQVAVPLPRYPQVAASGGGVMLNSQGYPLIAPASSFPHPHPHHLHLLPIAPRPLPAQPRTFADGPLTDHPNPLLEPDAKMDNQLRLRAMPPVLADTEYRRFPIYQPLPTDILLGRGGRSNQHAGNEWFREFVQLYRPTYHRIEKFNKMQLATNLVNYVRHCGGRFLQQVKTTGTTTPQPLSVWFEVGDVRARVKCSQCLREVTPDTSRDKPRRPSTTSTITTHATETDGLFYDEQDPNGDDPGILTI